MKKIILKESGIRNINKLADRYKKAKIYFHQDLDGVTTALAMKKYLEGYGIKVVDAEITQYGEKEFAIKKVDDPDVMPVLVDFANGKVMFKIHTDHHDRQTGVEKETSKSFKQSRSNVETISQIVSPKDLFPKEDLELISIVDSANFLSRDISVDEVINYLFKLDKNISVSRNKLMLGLVTNKLLLAYKNVPGYLEEIVMTSTTSLLNILLNIKRLMIEMGLAPVENLQQYRDSYIERMKNYKNLKIDDSIIVQYGGGKMTPSGSYDRYVPFKNNPEADFLVMAWPTGLVQASCNPHKKDRELKGVNLGDIGKEVIGKFETELKEHQIPLSTIKWISESSKDFTDESVGFTFKDFIALYGDKLRFINENNKNINTLKRIMDEPFKDLDDDEKSFLDNVVISGWDFITANPGGHKCITNISGLNYLFRSKRPPNSTIKRTAKSGDSPYVSFTKKIQEEFVKALKEKIKESKSDLRESIRSVLKKYRR